MYFNYLLTYDSYGPVHNRFHRGECITWASGVETPGLLNGIERSECHLGPGVSRAPSPPLACAGLRIYVVYIGV